MKPMGSHMLNSPHILPFAFMKRKMSDENKTELQSRTDDIPMLDWPINQNHLSFK